MDKINTLTWELKTQLNGLISYYIQNGVSIASAYLIVENATKELELLLAQSIQEESSENKKEEKEKNE